MSRTSPSAVEAFIESLPDFTRPMITKLCAIIREAAPNLEEVTRWHSPLWKGRGLVCSVAAFKNHVCITFWRGAELKNPRGQLIHGQGLSSMRTAKFTAPDQIDEKLIRAWVLGAVAMDTAGPASRPKRRQKPEPVVPPALAAALTKNPGARKAFTALPPSHRREYCEWIAEAKQEATARRRLEKTLAKLSAGEGLNDKYGK